MELFADVCLYAAYGLLAAVPLVRMVYAKTRRRMKRTLRNAEAVDISAFPDRGAAKIVGTVRALSEPLRAPLSGRRCVCYEMRVAKHDSMTPAIIREVEGEDFLVEDETGRALVRFRGSEVILSFGMRRKSDLLRDPTPEMVAFLERYGYEGRIYHWTYFYNESVIEEGDEVAVYGAGAREPDPDPGAAPGYRQTGTRVVLGATRRRPLLISDDRDAIAG